MSGIPLRWIFWALGVVLFAFAVWWLVGTVTGGKSDETRAHVEANRGEAMAGSAADAVGTVGERSAAEQETDEQIREVQDAIDNAKDLGGADAAARDGLCKQSADYC